MTYITEAISGSALGKAIKSIATRGKNLDTDTQSCLVQSLIQIEQHNNFDYASKTIKAMGRSQKGKAAVSYIMAHSPSRATYSGKTFAGFKLDKSDDAVAINITAAEQVNFWNYQPEKIDPVVTLASLEKRLDKLVEAAREHLSVEDMAKFVRDVQNVSLVTVVATELATTPIKQAA